MAMLVERSIEARKDRRPHLFLSHSSKNKPFVRQLTEELNTCEVDVWLDELELRIGDSLHDSLSSAMERSQYIALVISQHFHASNWANTELKQALARERREGRKVVLPLLIDDTERPSFVEDKIYLDFRTDYYHALTRLAGLLLDLSNIAIETAVRRLRPDNLSHTLDALRYAGHEPYNIVDEFVFDEILKAGGEVSGNRVRFNPLEILSDSTVSPMTKEVVRRLDEVWSGRHHGAPF